MLANTSQETFITCKHAIHPWITISIMAPVNKLKIHIQNMENICFMNVSLISHIHSRIHPQLMQEPLMHNRGSQKPPVLCVQTFPPESCILTQHLRAGLLNMSPGASLHTQMCTFCPQQAKLHFQRISQQHRARPHMAQHKQAQCRAGKEMDSRACSCPAIIHEDFGAARSCVSCASFSSLCRKAGEPLSKRRAEGIWSRRG